MTIASPSRTERKRARNRQALIGAARRLFAREGFDSTTIAAIAEAADLGFGTFYRYFDDKEAVLQAVLDQGRSEIDEVLSADDNFTGPAPEALARFTGRLVRTLKRNRDVLFLMWQAAVRDARLRPGMPRKSGEARRQHQLPAALESALERIIARGVKAGEFVEGDTALRARLVASTHFFFLAPSDQELHEDQIIDTLCDFELRALGAARPDGGEERR